MAKMTLEELVAQLVTAYDSTLVSVVLYGSAASGEHVPDRSDYNVLVIVRELPMARLRAVAAVARAWAEAGNPAPLTLTAAEWRASADIFPMEYADILERHRVLHGEMPIEGITVSPADLRLQVEHQAMGKLLQLRQGVLAAGADGKRQLSLLADSLSTIMVVFRGVVRLHGAKPPGGHEALSQEVGRRAGFDAEPFVRVARHVRGEEALTPAAAGDVLSGYLAGVQTLVSHLDRFSPGADRGPGLSRLPTQD